MVFQSVTHSRGSEEQDRRSVLVAACSFVFLPPTTTISTPRTMNVDIQLALKKALSTSRNAGAYLLARPVACSLGLAGLTCVVLDYRAWISYGCVVSSFPMRIVALENPSLLLLPPLILSEPEDSRQTPWSISSCPSSASLVFSSVQTAELPLPFSKLERGEVEEISLNISRIFLNDEVLDPR